MVRWSRRSEAAQRRGLPVRSLCERLAFSVGSDMPTSGRRYGTPSVESRAEVRERFEHRLEGRLPRIWVRLGRDCSVRPHFREAPKWLELHDVELIGAGPHGTGDTRPEVEHAPTCRDRIVRRLRATIAASNGAAARASRYGSPTGITATAAVGRRSRTRRRRRCPRSARSSRCPCSRRGGTCRSSTRRPRRWSRGPRR